MPSRRDPVVAVLHYFESADLALAQQGLALAQAIVRKRRDQTPRAVLVKARGGKRGPDAVPDAAPNPGTAEP